MLSSVTLDDANGNPVTIHLDTTTSKRGLTAADGLVGIGSLRDSKRPRPTGHGGLNETRWEDGKSIVLTGEIMSQSSVGDALAEFRIVTAPMLATLDTGPALLKWQEGIPGVAGTPATTSYRDEVIADAPISYWRLGESSTGSTLVDQRGVNNGSYVGSPTLGVASALADGDTAMTVPSTADGNYALCKTTAILGGSTNLSIEAWVKTTSNSGDIYCERNSSSGNDILAMSTDASGHLRLTFRDDAGTLNQPVSTAVVNDGNWHHVVITKTGTAIAFYIDGAASGTGVLTATNTFTNVLRVQIGDDSLPGFATGFNGSIDDVAVYNTALSAARVSTHYAARLLLTSAGSAGTIGGLALQRLVKLDGDVSPSLQEAAATLNYQAAFYAEDPRAYSQTLTTVNGAVLSTSAGGKTYNKTYNHFYNPTTGGNAVCTNAGNRPSPPILRILGGCTNPTITRLSNQAKLSLIGTIGTGDYLELDVAKRTVKLNGSSNATNLLDSANSDWASMEVPAGTETYKLIAPSFDANAALTVFYRSAYA